MREAVEKLEGRVGKLDEGIGGVREEVAALKSQAGSQPASEGEKPAAAATPASIDAAVSEAAGLFKAGKYSEAQAALKKIEAGNPSDARVYYLAALANGMVTSDWRGETQRLAQKAADLEKAGTPARASIDTALEGLLPQLKTWVEFYRKRAQ
ncbi:MAG: hypothetical protein U0835_05910 [Isosphaeraceae bacterium]